MSITISQATRIISQEIDSWNKMIEGIPSHKHEMVYNNAKRRDAVVAALLSVLNCLIEEDEETKK